MFVDESNFGARYFSLFLLNFAFASFGTVSMLENRPIDPLTDNFVVDLRLDLERYSPSTSEAYRLTGLHEQHRQYGVHLDSVYLYQRALLSSGPRYSRRALWDLRHPGVCVALAADEDEP